MASMEPSTKQFLPMPHQDPNSPSSSTSSSSSSSTSPSHPYHRAQPHHNLPPSPRPVPRTIETTPFPTTFVQADTTSFKQVVQMLTGSEQSPKNGATATAAAGYSSTGIGGVPAANGPCRPKKPSFKLYERRSSLKNLKMIAPLAMGAPPSPRKVATPEILSPSVLDFPSLKLSPVTPLTGDAFNPSPASSSGEAERAAIADKGFFFHPSPRGAEPPRLLPLFPVSSPRVATSAAAPSE